MEFFEMAKTKQTMKSSEFIHWNTEIFLAK